MTDTIFLLSNQLLPPGYLKTYGRSVVIYEPASFYLIDGHPVTATKSKYFKNCLSSYVEDLKTAGYQVKLIKSLNMKNKTFICFDFMDYEVEKEISAWIKSHDVVLVYKPNPMFLLSTEQRNVYAKSKKTFIFANFYKQFREELGIFPKPYGGQWSYDKDNRKPLDRSVDKLTEIEFPTNRKSALVWLRKFATARLKLFGPYEDAMSQDNLLLWHSGISPMLNMGLILPTEVIDLIPAPGQWTVTTRSSYEGFLRQLFWREYMAMVYRAEIPQQNIFSCKVNLPKSWYGTKSPITGIEIVDQKIIQAINYGYLHHIERLMLVGCFMLIAEIHPDQVYEWFMRCFVDAHHWVMVGNVYHMLMWASGRRITPRPYIGSTTYLGRMASYMSADDRTKWDKIYTSFIKKNTSILKHVYMMSGHIKRASKLSKTFS